MYDDFNPRDINWDKLFDLGGTEAVNAYVENLILRCIVVTNGREITVNYIYLCKGL